MQIIEGRYYRTRGGEKVGPMKRTDSDRPWLGMLHSTINNRWEVSYLQSYTENGSYWPTGYKCEIDLVAEWTDADTPPADAAPNRQEGTVDGDGQGSGYMGSQSHGAAVSEAVGGKSETQADPINHPPHYTFGRYEVIDVLQDWFPSHPLLWQVGKYVARAHRKGNTVQDLRKARFYLDREIERVSAIDAAAERAVGEAV